MTSVIITTNLGKITAELDAEKAPKTVANFLAYMQAGHYDNTIFHRVIDGFMIQGGGFEPGMKQKPADTTVENEAKNGWGYAVFGKVTEGKEVVDAIRAVKTSRTGMFADVPVTDVIIEKVEAA